MTTQPSSHAVLRALLWFTTAIASSTAFAGSSADYQLTLSEEIVDLVRSGDCEKAISKLNQDLQSTEKSGALLLAGVMHEAGACVQRDWSRAEDYYVRAAERGNRNAMLQLVALYGSVIRRDAVASLWWAHRLMGKPRGPANCVVETYEPDMTPEAFVEQLNRWGIQHVQACVYFWGVHSKLRADIYYPWGAMRRNEEGTVALSFSPSTGVFSAQLIKHDKVVYDGQWRVDDEPNAKGDLISYVRNASLKAAKRFERPPEVPVDLRWTTHFVFRME